MRLFFSLLLIYGFMIMASASSMAQNTQTAVLAGGCFWCLETDFKKLDGVQDAVSGYAGGTTTNPTYQDYSKHGHIEVVQVTYDADKLSYTDILNYFVRHIDPTDGEGQFCDRGASYRPAIFVKNKKEQKIATDVLKQTGEELGQNINVDILSNVKNTAPFYAAEDYHQDYATKNPIRYKFYRWNCGRDQRVQEIWGTKEQLQKPEAKQLNN